MDPYGNFIATHHYWIMVMVTENMIHGVDRVDHIQSDYSWVQMVHEWKFHAIVMRFHSLGQRHQSLWYTKHPVISSKNNPKPTFVNVTCGNFMWLCLQIVPKSSGLTYSSAPTW
jgi:hypothetical protein